MLPQKMLIELSNLYITNLLFLGWASYCLLSILVWWSKYFSPTYVFQGVSPIQVRYADGERERLGSSYSNPFIPSDIFFYPSKFELILMFWTLYNIPTQWMLIVPWYDSRYLHHWPSQQVLFRMHICLERALVLSADLYDFSPKITYQS